MFLQAPIQQLAGVTLPHVTWEPYFNLTPPEVSGNPNDPAVGLYSFNSQAEPSIFFQTGMEKVNIDPMAFMREFKEQLRPTEQRFETVNPRSRKKKIQAFIFHCRMANWPWQNYLPSMHSRQPFISGSTISYSPVLMMAASPVQKQRVAGSSGSLPIFRVSFYHLIKMAGLSSYRM